MNEILDKINIIEKALEMVPCNAANVLCKSITRKELDNRFYLAVVGEFKRGKSTMINSLIGQDILPSDILPTTATINILEYSEEEFAEIKYTDGRKEQLELTKENLDKFTAQEGVKAEEIDYISIGVKSDILKGGIVIIDTPGVNDISQSRVEVTKNILPNCDAAIFLLDAASPLTRTEAQFLETKILTYKLESLLFIISKSDRLDEDELEESLEGASSRIKEVLEYEAPLMAYSSREVMRSEEKGSTHEYKTKLIDYISELRKKSEETRNNTIKENLRLAISLLLSEIEKQISINNLSIQQLEEAQRKVLTLAKSNEVKFKQFILSGEYVGRTTLHDMFNASFDNFLNNLSQDCIDDIRLSNNVRDYYDKIMPVMIEKKLRRFGEQKGKEIHMYLSKITEHMTKEYNKNFHIPILQELQGIGVEIPNWQLEYNSNENVQPFVKNLFPITIGSIIGFIFMPGIGTLLGGAAGQIISMSKREKENEELRKTLIEEIPNYISTSLEEYRNLVHESIDKCFDKLFDNITLMNEENNKELSMKFSLNEDEENSIKLESNKCKLNNMKMQLNDMLSAL